MGEFPGVDGRVGQGVKEVGGWVAACVRSPYFLPSLALHKLPTRTHLEVEVLPLHDGRDLLIAQALETIRQVVLEVSWEGGGE